METTENMLSVTMCDFKKKKKMKLGTGKGERKRKGRTQPLGDGKRHLGNRA